MPIAVAMTARTAASVIEARLDMVFGAGSRKGVLFGDPLHREA
jgi:hypothetical protein